MYTTIPPSHHPTIMLEHYFIWFIIVENTIQYSINIYNIMHILSERRRRTTTTTAEPTQESTTDP